MQKIAQQYGWQWHYEAFAICRHCGRGSIILVSDTESESYKRIQAIRGGERKIALNSCVNIEGRVSIKDESSVPAPDHLPDEINRTFVEGARCLAVGCYNAAGTTFRLCVDLATRPLLPSEDIDGLTRKIRRDLGLRLPWLFGVGKLPVALQDLAACIREDGNDGAHQGKLTKADAEDLLDFTRAMLERMFTEPERLRLAAARRASRRQSA